jgi:hypothetical protein
MPVELELAPPDRAARRHCPASAFAQPLTHRVPMVTILFPKELCKNWGLLC